MTTPAIRADQWPVEATPRSRSRAATIALDYAFGLLDPTPVRRPYGSLPAKRGGKHLVDLAFVTRHIVSPAMSRALSHIGRQQSRGLRLTQLEAEQTCRGRGR